MMIFTDRRETDAYRTEDRYGITGTVPEVRSIGKKRKVMQLTKDLQEQKQKPASQPASQKRKETCYFLFLFAISCTDLEYCTVTLISARGLHRMLSEIVGVRHRMGSERHRGMTMEHAQRCYLYTDGLRGKG